MKKEIKFVGVGGQGVIMAASILARSASVYDGQFAVLTKKYTSDMRGGEVSSSVILSSERVIYPLVDEPDVLITLSQEAYDKYLKDLKPGGVLIYDSDRVTSKSVPGTTRQFGVPFNAMTVTHFKKRAVMNMLVLGFVNGVIGAVDPDSLKKGVAEMVPPKFIDLNLKVLEEGSRMVRDWQDCR